MTSPSVKRVAAKLGEDLRTARLRRRWSQKDVATKAGVSIGTIQRTESGDPGVCMGTIIMLFYIFGCQKQLEDALDPSKDETGLVADFLRLPQRIRSARRTDPRISPSLDPNDTQEDVIAF
ncbi:MAG: helix-turn-helix transcriptional regulator [Gammaproteobacteria bacterium]|nr:helix-turn-helix transcriptional regulator [Gammaproteobacteria bacterium]